jgi:hypothetical protein
MIHCKQLVLFKSVYTCFDVGVKDLGVNPKFFRGFVLVSECAMQKKSKDFVSRK